MHHWGAVVLVQLLLRPSPPPPCSSVQASATRASGSGGGRRAWARLWRPTAAPFTGVGEEGRCTARAFTSPLPLRGNSSSSSSTGAVGSARRGLHVCGSLSAIFCPPHPPTHAPRPPTATRGGRVARWFAYGATATAAWLQSSCCMWRRATCGTARAAAASGIARASGGVRQGRGMQAAQGCGSTSSLPPPPHHHRRSAAAS